MAKVTKVKSNKSFLSFFWKHIYKSFSEDQKDKVIPLKLPDLVCTFCNCKKVKWKNSILFYYSCDACVPRGCSCTLYKLSERTDFSIEDYDYKLGNDGLEIPCEEWERI